MFNLASISFERKQKFLNDLLLQANSIDFASRSSDIQRLQQKAETIFPLAVKDHQSKIEKFQEINFYPYFYSSGDNTKNEWDSFTSGKREAIDFIQGLIESNEILNSIEGGSLEEETSQEVQPKNKNEVFIVHGHDDALKDKVARFIENLNLKAIILNEQSDRGRTIISKFADHSDVGFAIVLYTPCDVGRPIKLNDQGKQHPERSRARQNVIFEHGFFAAKLGLENVVALKKGDVEIPNDLSGVVYKEYDEAGSWRYQIARELDESGYEIDYKLIK